MTVTNSEIIKILVPKFVTVIANIDLVVLRPTKQELTTIYTVTPTIVRILGERIEYSNFLFQRQMFY